MIPSQCSKKLHALGQIKALLLIAGSALVVFALAKPNLESIRINLAKLFEMEADFATPDRADHTDDETGESPRRHTENPGLARDGATPDGAGEATRNPLDAARSSIRVRLETDCEPPRMAGGIVHHSCDVTLLNPGTSTVYGIEIEAADLARLEQLGPVRWHPDVLPGGRRLRASYGDGSFHVLISELRAGETARAWFYVTGEAGDSRSSGGIQLARGR